MISHSNDLIDIDRLEKSKVKLKRSMNITSRSDIILVKYENILKDVDSHIIDILLKPIMKSGFKHLLDYNNISKDPELLMNRDTKNILEYFSLPEFKDKDFERYRNGIINRYMDFYSKSKFLPLAYDLRDVNKSRYVINKIYIWHHTKDYRVIIDCNDFFGQSSKVECVYDIPMEEFLKYNTDITTMITDDFADIGSAIKVNNIHFMEIMLAKYGYNCDIEGNPLLDIKQLSLDNLCKINMYYPYNIYNNE